MASGTAPQCSPSTAELRVARCGWNYEAGSCNR
eukprot:CAMPEP_0172745514 /NCGR_PEP_ID=MMETSP1074-20121228/138143_1 /TAXON_ID=2916 /ORGANISM="Ceratium fusus, Strain PA161109" /LENGTH=32 /DNA_ID= /DNA_START= /DNA_END= /DNA_ORIENTATION=